MKKLIYSNKNFILLLTLMLAFAISSCKKDDPDPTRLSVNITQQPMGGSDLNVVSVSFEGIISGTVNPINATVEWWWENGFHMDQKMLSSSEVTFNSGSVTSKSSAWSTAAGYSLLNYFWVKITWTDDDGPHTLESSKAFCGV